MVREVELVIFDLDGTLIDAYSAVASSVNYTLRRLGFPGVSEATVKRSVGWGEEPLMASFVGAKQCREALKLYQRHHREALTKGSRLLPGVRPLLSYLKKRDYKIAIASNRPTRFSNLLLKHLCIDKYFDCVKCADRVGRPKPHPALLLHILKRLGLTARQAIYVGDMVIDIEAGKRARIRTVAVATGSSSSRALRDRRPLKVIGRIDQLAKILGKMDGNFC